MSVEHDGFVPDSEKENPDEIIIFMDGNHPGGSYIKGKRSEMQLLTNEGGYPIEIKNPKVNDSGEVWGETKWTDSGKDMEVKQSWIKVEPIPDHWRDGQSSGNHE